MNQENNKSEGCGKTGRFRKELICGKTRVKFNPVSGECNYIWLCSECENKKKELENVKTKEE